MFQRRLPGRGGKRSNHANLPEERNAAEYEVEPMLELMIEAPSPRRTKPRTNVTCRVTSNEQRWGQTATTPLPRCGQWLGARRSGGSLCRVTGVPIWTKVREAGATPVLTGEESNATILQSSKTKNLRVQRSPSTPSGKTCSGIRNELETIALRRPQEKLHLTCPISTRTTARPKELDGINPATIVRALLGRS